MLNVTNHTHPRRRNHVHDKFDILQPPLVKEMDGEVPVYVNACLSIFECPTDDPTLKRVRVDMKEVPDEDGIDALCTVLVAYCQNAPTRSILHIRHVETEHLNPPSMHSLLAIAGRLMENKDVVARNLRGTIIQGTRIDEPVRVAHALFKTVYKPARLFEIVDSDEASKAHVVALVQQRMKQKRVHNV